MKYVITEYAKDPNLEIHVLNVQPRLRRNIAQFIGRRDREAFYRDCAEAALNPTRRMLDCARAPYSAHTQIGCKAPLIAAIASRLRCDLIVIGRARKNALTRFVEQSVSNQVLELATVPVVVIVGPAASKAERYGVPLGAGAALALLLVAAAD